MAASSDKSQLPKRRWFSLVAGGVAGAVEATTTYPTEYIKTQLQLQDGSGRVKFRGPIHCLTTTVRENGVLSLYRGLSAMIIGTASKAAIRFVSFERFKAFLVDEQGRLSGPRAMLGKDRMMMMMVMVIVTTVCPAAGMGAGVCEAVLVVTPTETIKTKLIHDQNQPQPKYRGLIHGVTTIIRTEGPMGIYRGLFPVVARQGANQAVRFSVYSSMKQWIQARQPANQPVHWATTFGIGMVAGTITVYATMPLDVVKTKMQGIGAKERYRNSLRCAYLVMKEEGLPAFWKGATPRLSRLIFSGGIVFTVYEQVLHLLNATVSDDIDA
ncbi:mitochondrial tricarboxylate transporter [Syncephalis pseudoplumigaleata]|uniref:Mitochondrial tricarboxylate transporter n=1 Tax=Syncephalis pseudoplumigaleata TaxID=1712513 RepID=A0A4V1J1G0_9FUNG|nr:mitochondrial tricarboxylate transporter [Syncephalis pseudoplumigaleata]|eukprot:RKP24929.1 mitochondrial tricarboxylate transporter [Syncephalis pseudoplumigaleata]